MRRITGGLFLSLDGVMQAPGGPGEDPTGGFAHGGWMAALADPLAGETVGALFTPPYALLLGRRTYDIFAAHWPHVEGEEKAFGEALTAVEKNVVTHDDTPLTWHNSHRLAGIEAIAALKASNGPDLLIQGSGTLYAPLLAAGLIDRLVTMTFPLLLGRGKRPWSEETPPTTLRMVEHRVSPAGLVVATWEPAGPVATGSFATGEPSAAEHERRRMMEDGRW